ncbi:MAG TPA: GntR family transcriptional regulator [Roseomonas sp.]|jgi:GntR family transcriptional regulator of vanillate catabolism
MDQQEPEVLVRLREMILQGKLPPGRRIPEAEIAEMLGISRTPVRQALPVLAKEGLLTPAGARGFAVRAFTVAEIEEGVDLRGTLEGFAARKLAERGASAAVLAELRAILAEGDAIFAKGALVEADEEAYGAMNGRFHAAVVEASGVTVVRDLLQTVNRIPFTAPATIAFDRLDLGQMFEVLRYAHQQHHAIVEAVVYREGARAEALFREHVNAQKRSMNLRPPPPAAGG